MRIQWDYFEIVMFSNRIMNPNHNFWLLRIIKNLGNKKFVIVIKKCANIVYWGIIMNKTIDCECCKYIWEYKLYCFVSR
jgi:hypothetical protein